MNEIVDVLETIVVELQYFIEAPAAIVGRSAFLKCNDALPFA